MRMTAMEIVEEQVPPDLPANERAALERRAHDALPRPSEAEQQEQAERVERAAREARDALRVLQQGAYRQRATELVIGTAGANLTVDERAELVDLVAGILSTTGDVGAAVEAIRQRLDRSRRDPT